MFVFIVPKMPLKFSNALREELFGITCESLRRQKSRNWKALILGEDGPEKNNEHFIYIKADDYSKAEKLKMGLHYIASHPELKAEYVIRLDADDIISPFVLYNIERLPQKYDLYYDAFHVCIDPVYMKISYRKNDWVPNTAIHRYEYAITEYGPENELLFTLDHDLAWHKFYTGKKIFLSQRHSPLYYRILTPFSITSTKDLTNTSIHWEKHLKYLNSYGPWIPLPHSFSYYNEIKKISAQFEDEKPEKPYSYWLFNRLKHYKNLVFAVGYTRLSPGQSAEESAPAASALKACTRCILSTSDTKYISFDSHGVCNYCRYYDNVTSRLGSIEQRTQWISSKVEEIKKAGKNKKYDCILGISGGIDSSYLSYWARENGLRPLVVHFDNGWNSELATENIRNICEKLGFELNTYVINWEEFRDLQLAYFRAGVIDIEALTDHAIIATIFQIAAKHRIKYTLSGFNFATEAIMPRGWVFDKSDWENIKDIYSKFGRGKKIKTFPHINFYKKLFYHWFLKLESIQVLNYIEYNKEDAKKTLVEKLSWRDYGGKHYESVFTKFYQSYILPVRFGVDKRKAHLSSLICSGQISRAEALEQMAQSPYTEKEIGPEKEYVLKKLNLKAAEFDRLMKQPVRTHEEFRTEKKLWGRYFRLVKLAKFDFS